MVGGEFLMAENCVYCGKSLEDEEEKRRHLNKEHDVEQEFEEDGVEDVE